MYRYLTAVHLFWTYPLLLMQDNLEIPIFPSLLSLPAIPLFPKNCIHKNFEDSILLFLYWISLRLLPTDSLQTQHMQFPLHQFLQVVLPLWTDSEKIHSSILLCGIPIHLVFLLIIMYNIRHHLHSSDHAHNMFHDWNIVQSVPD